MPENNLRMLPWLLLICTVIVLDQATKAWALTFTQSTPVTPFFDLVLAFNRGAAFSFLSNHSGWQRWFFVALAMGVSGWLLVLTWQHKSERLLPLSFALIIGGALGNVIDRFRIGAVVDFLSFHAGTHYWPAFNIADAAITTGVGLMIVAQWCTRKTQEKPA